MRVYRYEPLGTRWCREGTAIEVEDGVLLDTFWSSGADRHRLSAAEVAAAEFVFDTDEYDELPKSRRSVDQWLRYRPDQRQSIASQHGLEVKYFVFKGAQPDLATQIENALQRVQHLRRERDSAQSRLEWAIDELRELQASGGDS